MTIGSKEVWLPDIFVLEFEQASLSIYKWFYPLSFSRRLIGWRLWSKNTQIIVPKVLFYFLKGKVHTCAQEFWNLGLFAKLIVDDSTYLIAFLVCWLNGYVSSISSTTIPSETVLW